MRRGVAHGRVVAFFEAGGKRFEGHREGNRRAGAWTWWNETGRVIGRCRFAGDAIVEGTCGPIDVP